MRRQCIAVMLMAFLLLAGTHSNGQAAPKEEPVTVNWIKNIFTLQKEASEGAVVTEEVQREIADLLDSRLHSLQSKGSLPFVLKESNESYSFNHSVDNPVGLVALVVDDSSIKSEYDLHGETCYKEIVLCGIDVMLCSSDSEDGSMRVLHTIPLRGYDVLGGDYKHLIKEPITVEQRREVFVGIAKNLIQKQLDFARYHLSQQDTEIKKVHPETYQVTEVEFVSPKAQIIFAGQEDKIKALLGGVFTSAYQKTTNKIVYPPLPGGQWKADAADNLWTLEMNSPAQNLRLTMNQAKHPIKLELTGVADQEIHGKNESSVKIDWGYKAWLKKTPVNGREKAELSKIEVKQFSARNSIRRDVGDIYVELLIGLAGDLAKQQE